MTDKVVCYMNGKAMYEKDIDNYRKGEGEYQYKKPKQKKKKFKKDKEER